MPIDEDYLNIFEEKAREARKARRLIEERPVKFMVANILEMHIYVYGKEASTPGVFADQASATEEDVSAREVQLAKTLQKEKQGPCIIIFSFRYSL